MNKSPQEPPSPERHVLFEAEWVELFRLARTVALGIVHDDERARDVAQDTMEVAIRKMDPRCTPLQRRAFVASTARNLALYSRRTCIRREKGGGWDFEPVAPDGDTSCEKLSAWVWAIAKLPEKDQELLRRRYHDEARVCDIAAEYSVSANTVSNWLHRARLRLRELFDRELRELDGS